MLDTQNCTSLGNARNCVSMQKLDSEVDHKLVGLIPYIGTRLGYVAGMELDGSWTDRWKNVAFLTNDNDYPSERQ